MIAAALPNSTFSFGDRAKDSINSVSRIGEFHLHLDNRERLQRRKIRPEVDGIFLCGDEAASLDAVVEVKQLPALVLGVGVMIAIVGLCYRGVISGTPLQH